MSRRCGGVGAGAGVGVGGVGARDRWRCPVGVVVCTVWRAWRSLMTVLGPAGCLFGVVAGLAEPLEVGRGGRAALVGGDHVVGVAGRGVAPGGPAQPLVAQVQVRREAVGGQALLGRQGDEVAGRVGVEPADPGSEVLGGPGDGLPRDLGRHRPPSGDRGGLVTGTEQGLVGEDHLDSDRHPGRGGLSGQAGDHQVGHQLAPRPGVALGPQPVGLTTQGDVGGDGLDHRQQPGQVGHRVRCGAQADPPFGLGAAVAAPRPRRDRSPRPGGVPPPRPARSRGPRRTGPRPARVRRGPHRGGRAARGPGTPTHARSASRGTRSASPRAGRPRCGAGRPRGPSADPTSTWPRCGDSCRARATCAPTPLTPTGGRDPRGGVLGPHRGIQGDGEVGLRRTQCGLQLLHRRDRLDPSRVRGPVLSPAVHALGAQRDPQGPQVVEEGGHEASVSNTSSTGQPLPQSDASFSAGRQPSTAAPARTPSTRRRPRGAGRARKDQGRAHDRYRVGDHHAQQRDHRPRPSGPGQARDRVEPGALPARRARRRRRCPALRSGARAGRRDHPGSAGRDGRRRPGPRRPALGRAGRALLPEDCVTDAATPSCTFRTLPCHDHRAAAGRQTQGRRRTPPRPRGGDHRGHPRAVRRPRGRRGPDRGHRPRCRDQPGDRLPPLHRQGGADRPHPGGLPRRAARGAARPPRPPTGPLPTG